MWKVIHFVPIALCFVLGLFCVVSAILLYPGEEGTIQSRLEDFWVRLDDYSGAALSRQTIFLQQIARVESQFLDKTFGHKLLSLRALVTSYCIAFFCLGCCMVITDLQLLSLGYDTFGLHTILYIWLPPYFLIMYLGLPEGSPNRNLLIGFGVALIVFDFGRGYFEEERSEQSVNVMIDACYFLGGPLCDFGFIAVTRRLLRSASETTSSFSLMGMALLNFLLAAILVGPLFVTLRPWHYPPSNLDSFVQLGLTQLARSNLFDGLLALLFVILPIVLLIHRVFWPILGRSLFRVQALGTKGRRGVLIATGTALLGLSGVHIGGLFHELLTALGRS
jgi:hypothetical protein